MDANKPQDVPPGTREQDGQTADPPDRGRVMATETRTALSAIEFALLKALGNRPFAGLSAERRHEISGRLASEDAQDQLMGLGDVQRELTALATDFVFARGRFPNAAIGGVTPFAHLRAQPNIDLVMPLMENAEPAGEEAAMRMMFNFAFGAPFHIVKIALDDNPLLAAELETLPRASAVLTGNARFAREVAERLAGMGYGFYQDSFAEVPDGRSKVHDAAEWFEGWRTALDVPDGVRLIDAWKVEGGSWDFALTAEAQAMIARSFKHSYLKGSGCPMWRPAPVSPITPEPVSGIELTNRMLHSAMGSGSERADSRAL